MSLDPQREAEIRERAEFPYLIQVSNLDLRAVLDALDALRDEQEKLKGAVRGALQELWDGQTFTAAAMLRDALPPEVRP